MGNFDFGSILSSLFNSTEINALNSSGVNLNSFLNDYKSLRDSDVNPLKLIDNLNKLSSLGLNVNSIKDLENVKNLDVNKITSNSIDLKLVQTNLNKVQNTGINLETFKQTYSKVKQAGLNMEKINDIPNLLSSNLLSQGGNLLSGLTGGLTNNTQGQGGSLLNQGQNLLGGLLGNVGKSNTTSLDNNLKAKSEALSDVSKPQNTDVVKPPRTKAIQILVPSQYIDVYVMAKWSGAPALLTHPDSKQLVWYDKEFDKTDFIPSNLTYPAQVNDNGTKDFGIGIHLGYPGGKKVGDWSEDGSQCFSSEEDLNEFFKLCEKHVNLNGNIFSYTLATKDDWEQAFKNVEANKVSPPVEETIINANSISTSQTTNTNQTQNAEGKPSSEAQSASGVATQNTSTPQNIVKPIFFETKLDIIAFQVWANKNKLKTSLLGEWDESTQKAWNDVSTPQTPGSGYIRSLRGITNSELKLVHARLSPYGSATFIGSLVYKASFSESKISLTIDDDFPYSVIFNESGEFRIVDNFTKVDICKGQYSNGGRSLTITDGLNKGKVVENEVAWDGITSCITQSK